MKGNLHHRWHKFVVVGLLGTLLLLIMSGCFALGYRGYSTVKKPAASAEGTTKPVEKQQSPIQALEHKKDSQKDSKEDLTAPLKAGTRYTVLVDKSEHKVYIKDGDTVVRIWDCAVGKGGLGQKQRRGDDITPVGTFLVDEIDDASSWTHDFGDGKGQIAGAYGPWFLSLNTYGLSKGKWDGIGIHGTHDPASLGTNASEGCVRLFNANLVELKNVTYIGMPVTIQD